MTITVILLLIPVIGSIVGLIGKSWDDNKESKIKLTLRGWVSLLIILIGIGFSGFNTIRTEIENDNLKQQRNKVRALVYDKLYHGCIQTIEPIKTIYIEQTKHLRSDLQDYYSLCLEMASDSAQKVFEGCNMLDSVRSGTAFDEWDKSYADYVYGYYNKEDSSLESTMTRWAHYIEMEDLIILDKIVNHQYLVTLKNVRYGDTQVDKSEFRRKVGVFYFFEDEDILKDQNDWLLTISFLIRNSEKYIDKKK